LLQINSIAFAVVCQVRYTLPVRTGRRKFQLPIPNFFNRRRRWWV